MPAQAEPVMLVVMLGALTNNNLKSNEMARNTESPDDLVRRVDLLQAVVKNLNPIDARVIDVTAREFVEPLEIHRASRGFNDVSRLLAYCSAVI